MSSSKLPILVAGGGIGGLAAALALTRRGFSVRVLEQSPEIGEIGAGIQLGPNAFHALDALGVGPKARGRAVYTDELVMHDAIDEYCVGRIPTGEAFRKRFGNPYAVIHRVDVHTSLLEGALETGRIDFLTSTRATRIEQDDEGVTVIDQNGIRHRGAALVAADGVKSVAREQYVGDPPRVTGHVVYRAVVDRNDFPADLQCHLVHYPLRGGEQYNVVVTFHSRQQEQWGVTEGSKAEVQSYFQGIVPMARQLIDLPKSWKRWATADREPIGTWSFGRVTLLGDAAHPMLQYLAQGACMAMEDAVCLADCLSETREAYEQAFVHYQQKRYLRTTRVQLTARLYGHVYHAEGAAADLRNAFLQSRTAEQTFDSMAWIYQAQ